MCVLTGLNKGEIFDCRNNHHIRGSDGRTFAHQRFVRVGRYRSISNMEERGG